MIKKNAIDEAVCCQTVILTKAARVAWEMILRTLPKGASILLPCYIGVTEREGSGIYDPVRNVGVSHDFYMLTDDLQPNRNSLFQKIEENEYDLVLIVHYFGFEVTEMPEIIDACQKKGVVVVEDCAHLYSFGLQHIFPAGTYGDYAFYSLHKYFPFKEGGMLFAPKNIDKGSIYTDVERPSINLLSYDSYQIAMKRRHNFRYLDGLISKIEGLEPLKVLRENDIPQSYPVIIKEGLREKLYFWLLERKISLTALYYRLIDPLQSPVYKKAKFISDNILNLPVHQDTSEADLVQLAAHIEEGLRELKREE